MQLWRLAVRYKNMMSGGRGGQIIYAIRPIHFVHQIIATHYSCRYKDTYTVCLSLYQQAVKVCSDVKVNPISSAITGSEWLASRSRTASTVPLSVECRRPKGYSECVGNRFPDSYNA